MIEREERIALEQLAEVVPEDPGDHEPGELLAAGVAALPRGRHAAGPPPGGSSCCRSRARPSIVREHVEVNRARVLARIEALVRLGARAQRRLRHDLDVELTARAIRDWSEQAGRMVLTDPERYPPERYERFVRTVPGIAHAMTHRRVDLLVERSPFAHGETIRCNTTGTP